MPPAPELSFCIVTGGQRAALLATVIQSIRAQHVPAFEILVVGRHRGEPGIRYLAAEAAADAGRLGAMRNLAVANARFEHIVMLDDDVVLAPDWYARLDGAPDLDVLTCQLRLPDGSRYWDHATCGGPLGHRMLDPEESDPHLYMTGGGAWIARREICERVRWDEQRGLYQNEDTDFAERLRAAGMRVAHHHASVAYHVAPQYTAVGRAVVRRTGGHGADWVESLRRVPPESLAQEIQRLFRDGSIAELADALRLACRIHPGVGGFRDAWCELEALHGGPLRDARWTTGLDSELGGALALYASSDEPVPTLPRVHARARAERPGVNLFGFLSGNLGLGVAARAYLRLLVDRGVPVHGVDIRVGGERRITDASFPAPVGTALEPAPHDVNVLVVNPDDVAVLARAPAFGAPGTRLQVCVPFWELPRLPPSWLPTLGSMDVIAAPSQMIRHAALASVAGPRVAYWPLPVFLPERARPSRRRFGLSDDETVFVAAFEMASDMNRKNPLGVIEAFRRAFPAGHPARLVIKVNNGRASISHLHTLVETAKRDPRILVFDRVLDYAEVLSLYASADALVSLHRAEGFGLCMAEAMSLGRPVIATAWSGNMDFMCERNACLVRYTLEPVLGTNQAAYREEYTGPGARWAEPDLDDAARWMRVLAEDPELRMTIGKRAASDMAARQAGLGVDDLLQALANAHRA